MKKFVALALTAAALVLGVTVPAEAAPQRVESVAPITCYPNEDSCVVVFVANAGNGYYMARQESDVPPYTWVRLTLVPGWSTAVAPITCRYSNSCNLDYVGISQGSFWRANQASTAGPWVRLTLVNGS